ncbi:hypothetical protein PHYC_03508 [Phycisphaerales bacterium]|nr:hypothetical protein PHYC_03508 [Phycisphaerales bacterium]
MNVEGSVTVSDARGRFVATCFPPGRRATIDVKGLLSHESFQRICRRVGARVERDSRGSMIAIGVLVGVVGVGLFVPAFLGAGAFVLWIYAFPAMIGSALMVWTAVKFRPRMPPVDPQLLAEAVGAEGLCATCGYRLDDLPAEEDGCVVCPECGSAWVRDVAPPLQQ